MSIDKPRKPKGSPQSSGGQFASRTRSAAPVATITDDSPELLESVFQTAMLIAGKTGVNLQDAEDIAQDAIVELIEIRDRNGFTNGPNIGDNPGLVHNVVKSTALSYRADAGESRDRRARVMLRDAVQVRAAELGRELSEREVDELAESIRLSFSPRKRPVIGFHRYSVTVSLQDVVPNRDGGSTERADVLQARDEVNDDEFRYNNDSFGDTVEELELKSADELKDAKERIWEIFKLTDDDLRTPQPNTVTKNRQRTLREEVRDRGGVEQLMYSFRDGSLDAHSERIIFEPFGDVNDREKESIAKVLMINPKQSENLWKIALKNAGPTN